MTDFVRLILPPVAYLLYGVLLKSSGVGFLFPLGMGLCAALLLWKCRGKRRIQKLSFPRILSLAVLTVSLTFVGTFFGAVQQEPDAGELFCVCAAAPLCEELIYRGFVFSEARKYFGTVISAVISTLFFAAAHAGTAQIGYALIGGMVFCAICDRTENLVCCVFVHSAVNILSYCKLLSGIGKWPAVIAAAVIPVYLADSFFINKQRKNKMSE